MKVRDMIPRGTLIYHTGKVPSHITWYRFVLLVNENVNLTQNRNYYVDEDYYLMN